jgi:hypothetical protein
MTAQFLIWDPSNKVIVEEDDFIGWRNVAPKHIGRYVLDRLDNSQDTRYGRFTEEGDNPLWNPKGINVTQFTDFPAEFRAHLLLLGVQ